MVGFGASLAALSKVFRARPVCRPSPERLPAGLDLEVAIFMSATVTLNDVLARTDVWRGRLIGDAGAAGVIQRFSGALDEL